MTNGMLLAAQPLTEAVWEPAGLLLEATLLAAGPSLNGTYYPTQTLEQAVPRFAGAKCYLDHSPAAVRSVLELAGRVEEAWYAGGRIRGRIRMTAAHPALETLVREGLAGELSITALGQTRLAEREGRLYRLVESLDEIRSVDFVTEAAAGGRVERILTESRLWETVLASLQDELAAERSRTFALLDGACGWHM